MSLEMVKNLMKDAGWGFLATSDGKKVGVRPMGSCVWMDNELWAATTEGTEKIMQLREVPYAEYCFSDREGKHVRIAGTCTISTNNDDKLKLYEAVPILKKYIKDPDEPTYVVIRMKPERIRLMAEAGKGYEDIEVPK
jgi:general stress protein 26